jgi:hypothetical protein
MTQRKGKFQSLLMQLSSIKFAAVVLGAKFGYAFHASKNVASHPSKALTIPDCYP